MPRPSELLQDRNRGSPPGAEIALACENIHPRNRELVLKLWRSDDPSVRYKILVGVLGEDARSRQARALQRECRRSERFERLLSERDEAGRIPHHPYSKWRGAHWVLADLAEMGYPPGDRSLIPLRQQVMEWLFSSDHLTTRCIRGRTRMCASMEGNALYSQLVLGLVTERTNGLAERLIMWQWPDGGWNCDKRPRAVHSSFMETLIPLRALALYAKRTGDNRARDAVERAAEVFLKRRLFKRVADGTVISPNWLPQNDFLNFHFPNYWYYDVLFSLKVMAEAGFIGDSRCAEALNFLESKRLDDQGFPAERKNYHLRGRRETHSTLVNWGGASDKRLNEYVSVDALLVLKAANRL